MESLSLFYVLSCLILSLFIQFPPSLDIVEIFFYVQERESERDHLTSHAHQPESQTRKEKKPGGQKTRDKIFPYSWSLWWRRAFLPSWGTPKIRQECLNLRANEEHLWIFLGGRSGDNILPCYPPSCNGSSSSSSFSFIVHRLLRGGGLTSNQQRGRHFSVKTEHYRESFSSYFLHVRFLCYSTRTNTSFSSSVSVEFLDVPGDGRTNFLFSTPFERESREGILVLPSSKHSSEHNTLLIGSESA